VGSLEVVDLDLDAARPGVLEPAHQLDADRAAVLLEPQVADELRAHEPEVAVDVADRKPKQESHRGRVDRSHQTAVERIGAVALVALDPVRVLSGVRGKPGELCGVVLAVAVGVEDPFAVGLRERGAQRASVAAVGGVLDDAQAGLACRGLGEADVRFIGRAVVHDHDLGLGVELVKRRRGALDEPRDRLGVVVTEQAGRDRALGAQASAAQTRSTSPSLNSG